MRKYLMFTFVWLLTSICVANRVDVNEVFLTDAHSWDLEYIELHDDYTLCKWKVTSLVEKSYVCMTKGAYLEDVMSGKKYYAKGVDGLPYEPEMKLINTQYEEVDFVVKFEALPMHAKTIHYISSPSFQIKNIELLKKEPNIEEMIEPFNKASQYMEEKNDAAAVNLFKEMAEKGFSLAQYNLSRSYLNGKGVSRDFKKAAYWAKRSAQAGFSEGCLLYANFCFEGIGTERNLVESAKWMLKAAESGSATAQCYMGMNYDAGTGVKQDYVEAAKWYRKAAEEGVADAANNLGFLYESGKGVNTDLKEAAKWYLLAAEKGMPSSQYALGMMYLKGEGGLKSDKQEAIKWLKLAAENGFTKAKIKLAEME